MFYSSFEALLEQLKTRRKGQKLVFTNGCFDLLHIGHLRYLQEARKQGNFLVVGLNSDESVKALKGEDRPFQKAEERAEILGHLKMVDYSFIFHETTPLKVIQAIEPDVLVKGGDWEVTDIVGSEFVLSKGGEVKSLSFVEGRSTTHLVDQVRGSQQ